MISLYHRQRLSGNVKILVGITLFAFTTYAYSIYKMGHDDFKDINDFGNKIEDEKDLSKLKRVRRGSVPPQQPPTSN
ncbi:hypothetical protein DLAC_05297 [Tieghemostelium lacteum]|uniref:Cytochrome c oxidase assembly factor 3 n=1 Tax=Tieghemostelium lacteum TaxID=361077 RepID=A0A151ZJB3_TIELA|nr:hypothetical protein DLAC_05297 [Tieghemostelium lacteum]|eukprot:KYQ93894.1 hypothetical protein DLAC_05297 [Tieghemostelium lacteum]